MLVLMKSESTVAEVAAVEEAIRRMGYTPLPVPRPACLVLVQPDAVEDLEQPTVQICSRLPLRALFQCPRAAGLDQLVGRVVLATGQGQGETAQTG